MPTFKHSGDLGDIIFALPAVRALGGGTLLLDPQGGASEPAVAETAHPRKRTRLTPQAIEHQSAETVRQVAVIIKGEAPVGAVNAERWTRHQPAKEKS